MKDDYEEYRSNALYDVWKRGGDPDRISDDRVADAYYAGRPYDAITSDFLREVKARHEEREYEEYLRMQQEEEWYDEMREEELHRMEEKHDE